MRAAELRVRSGCVIIQTASIYLISTEIRQPFTHETGEASVLTVQLTALQESWSALLNPRQLTLPRAYASPANRALCPDLDGRTRLGWIEKRGHVWGSSGLTQAWVKKHLCRNRSSDLEHNDQVLAHLAATQPLLHA